MPAGLVWPSARASREWWRPRSPHARTTPGVEPRGSAVAFGALLGFTFVLLLAPQNFLPVLARLRIALLLAAAAIAAQVFHTLVRGLPLTRVTPEIVAAGALAGWAVATAPLSYWPGGTAALLLDLYLKSLAVFWLIANVADSAERVRRLCWALTLLAIPLSLAALRNFASGVFIADSAYLRIMGYDAPLTQNPNDLALLLNLVLPLGVALLPIARGPLRPILPGILVLHGAAVIVTFSRTGFLTLATTGAVYLAKHVTRGRWGAVGAALVLVAVAAPLLPSGYLERLATIADVQSDPTQSAQTRWNDTVAALRYVLENPVIGAGAGMNILAMNDVRGPTWKAVHNAYLEHAVDLGLPGFTLFLLLLGSCFRSTSAVRRRCSAGPHPRELSSLAEGIQVSLVAFCVAAFFHPVAYQFYFFIVAGLAAATRAAVPARQDTL